MQRTRTKISYFLLAAVAIFILTLSVASSVGFVPYYLDPEDPRFVPFSFITPDAAAQPAESTTRQAVAPLPEGIAPEHMTIEKIDLDLPVSNPQTRDLEALDVVLKKGPARYMDSALLGQNGNVLIFGHSSHLPVVINQMYKAFNRIPELEAGDEIVVSGGGREFTYRVTSVVQMDANEGVIDLRADTQKLTIVTCDTLTGKSARYVLEAEFIAVK